MINKRNRTNFFLIFSLLTMLLSFKSIVKAIEVPEVEVQISSSGVVVDGNITNNVLTENSSVLLPGDELFTSDSKTKNDFNGTKPGDSIVIDIGCIPVDSEGNRITSMDVTLQAFINTTKEGVIEGYCSTLSDADSALKSVISDSINACDDVLGSIYGTYLETTYNTQIVFNNDGTATL